MFLWGVHVDVRCMRVDVERGRWRYTIRGSSGKGFLLLCSAAQLSFFLCPPGAVSRVRPGRAVGSSNAPERFSCFVTDASMEQDPPRQADDDEKTESPMSAPVWTRKAASGRTSPRRAVSLQTVRRSPPSHLVTFPCIELIPMPPLPCPIAISVAPE